MITVFVVLNEIVCSSASVLAIRLHIDVIYFCVLVATCALCSISFIRLELVDPKPVVPYICWLEHSLTALRFFM